LAGFPVDPVRSVGLPVHFMQFEQATVFSGGSKHHQKIALKYDARNSAMKLFNRLNRATGQPAQPTQQINEIFQSSGKTVNDRHCGDKRD
jgi:hypothetical protein